MIDIISIGTAVPVFRSFRQKDIMQLMQKIYGLDERESRKFAFMYRQSDIETRYTVIDTHTDNGNRNSLIFSEDEAGSQSG